MFLVTGATGNVGGKLVQLLTGQGHAVRALVRNPGTVHFPDGVDVAVLEDLYILIRAGRAGVLTDDVRNITGQAPGTFRAWCERNAAAFS